MQGTIPVWALPPSVAQFVYYGEAIGRASRQPEIDALEAETNRLHALAFETDAQRRERILRRLDRGLAIADEATWDRLEQDLQQMRAAAQLNTLKEAA